VAILLDDPSRFVFDHQFRVLVLSELTSPADCLGLPFVQGVSWLRSICLHGPTSARSRLNGNLRFARHASPRWLWQIATVAIIRNRCKSGGFSCSVKATSWQLRAR
jgi:hypothetical protein